MEAQLREFLVPVVDHFIVNNLARIPHANIGAHPFHLTVGPASVLEEIHGDVIVASLQIDGPLPARPSVKTIVVNHFRVADE